jgi:hypothetical protein
MPGLHGMPGLRRSSGLRRRMSGHCRMLVRCLMPIRCLVPLCCLMAVGSLPVGWLMLDSDLMPVALGCDVPINFFLSVGCRCRVAI